MRGKWVLLSVALILAAIAAGALSVWRPASKPGSAPTANGDPQPVEPVPTDITLPGKVQAQRVVSAGPQVAGRIEYLAVGVGQEVFEGQLLARVTNSGLESAQQIAAETVRAAEARVNAIESSIAAAKLEASRAQADATRARSEFDRLDKLYRRQQVLNSQGATPRLTYEKSQREFESTQTEFRSLDALARQSEERVAQLLKDRDSAKRSVEDKTQQLEDIKLGMAAAELHAPADGFVVSRAGEVGDQVSAEDRDLFQIAVDLSLLEVVLEPEPPTLKRIKAGQPALVFIADVPGEGIPGIVKDIQGTNVIVTFTSPNPALRPGITAQVRIKVVS